jgi:signal transduction histidine kinase
LKECTDANVIVLTGFNDKRLGLNAVKVGAQDYLVKGEFQAEELAKVLRYSIERKNVLNKLAESQSARELAEESARMKEKFIAGISHEMRTPMNAIYGMSNLLDETPLDEEQKDMVDAIKLSSRILLGIINDILEISTLQNGVVDFHNHSFDLYELLDQLIKMLEYNKKGKPIELSININSSVPRNIIGDSLRLNQILFNLVGNAIKFTDSGLVSLHVAAERIDINSYKITFQIIDTGIGIEQEKLIKVFENFTRIHTKDRIYEGTGLGLSIVKNLVEQQGGNIKVESKVGEGSSFSFSLNYDIDNNFTSTLPSKIEDHSFDDNYFDVLIVEDNKMNQIVAKKTLEKKFRNISVSLVENGKECIDFLSKNKTDLILMDIQMPIMDGYETTRIIRNELYIKDLPILVMTAHAHISMDNKIFEMGFNDFVLKPFEPEDLKQKIIKFIFKK